MEAHISKLMEVSQQTAVSTEQADLHDEGMTEHEHGLDTNVNIDHGSSEATTRVLVTHSHCQEMIESNTRSKENLSSLQGTFRNDNGDSHDSDSFFAVRTTDDQCTTDDQRGSTNDAQTTTTHLVSGTADSSSSRILDYTHLDAVSTLNVHEYAAPFESQMAEINHNGYGSHNNDNHTFDSMDHNYEKKVDGHPSTSSVIFENNARNIQVETFRGESLSDDSLMTIQDRTEDTNTSLLKVDDKLAERFDINSLGYELQVGYKILIGLMGAGNRCINKLFIHPVDDNFPETAEYYKKIKRPMWMLKMKEKFESSEYEDLTEFLADFRLMIENCYRFNGPDNFVSKKAQKLELMMKQKIALLSKELREKLMGSVSTDDDIFTTAGIRRRIKNPNLSAEDPSQQLLSQLRRDKVLQQREDRKQRSEDKKALEHARIQEIHDWEDNFIGKDIKEDLRTMWEIPQIGLFVYLCMETLGLDEEITQFQLERGLVAPRVCADFKRLMTCLLSTPHQRKSLKSFMPYHVWNHKLTQKLLHFYKVLSDCNGNNQRACYKLGFDNRAFKVIGKTNPLLKKAYHELSFRKRVWILKSLCDFCLETQPELQKTIDEAESERPSDVREVLLGSDGRGYRYINFPMFTGKDIRIYRHSKIQEPSLRSLGLEEWSTVEEKPSNTSSRCSTPVNPRSQRLYPDQASSSLRARAILQAAESKEASPMRDFSRTGSDVQDENSNSKMDADSVNSEVTDSNGKKSGGSLKKRKRSYFGGKRKRFKGNKKALILDNQLDEEMDEEQLDGTDNSPVSNKTETVKDDSNIVPKDKVCDKDSSNVCDVRKNILSDLASETQLDPCEEASDSDSNTALANPANLFNNYASHVEPVNSPLQERDKMGEGLLPSGSSETKNHDSAYLSCDSDKSFKTEDETDLEKASQKLGSDSGVKNEKVLVLTKVKGEPDLSNSVSIGQGVQDTGDDRTKKSEGIEDVIETLKSDSFEDLKKTLKSDFNEDVKNSEDFCADIDVKKEVDEVTPDETKEKIDSVDEDNVKSEEALTEIAMDTSLDGAQSKASPEIKEEIIEEEESEDEDDIPDLGHIELVAESMEDIRQLIQKLSNPDPIKRGKRTYPGVIKPCEEELRANLSRFHDELTKYERSLFNARVHAQVKLRKEVESYVEPKVVDSRGWESEVSQSSKEDSEDEEFEAKKEATPKEKQQKKSKSKGNSTSELLCSAANKLSSISGDANEDSNDSYELDISSRGRLRKRRVIPNNTEDTCLKKRKNLLNQDLPSVSTPTSGSPTPNTASFSSGINTVSHVLSSSVQQQQLKSWPQHLLSVVSSPSNSVIKAQLTSPSKPRMPCQIVRLVSPSGDASYKTVHIAGKRSMANIRLISSTGVITVPKDSILTSSSSAHSSHPVIQQLLLSQARRPLVSSSSTLKTPSSGSIASQIGTPQQQWTASNVVKSLSSGASSGLVKVTLVSPNNPSSTMTTTTAAIKTPSTTSAVVVTQVSTSIVSHGGKQILDLGSLSVTQIQQLVKNQAIQINTGAGNPTTLLLTKGLQQLATNKVPTQPATTTLASASTNSSLQIRMPIQGNSATTKTDAKESPAKSLLSPSSGNPKAQIFTIPGTLSSPAGPMTVLSGRQVAHQLPLIRTIINRPVQNAPLVRAINPSLLGATVPMTQVVGGTTRLPVGSQGSFTVVPGGVFPRQIPAPRIISSLQSPVANIPSTVQASANKENPPISLNTSSGQDRQVIGSDLKKTSHVNIPFSSLSSPQKKYASNVTVKALLENRTYKKTDADGNDVSNLSVLVPKGLVSVHSQETSSLPENIISSHPITAAPSSISSEITSLSATSNDSVNSVKSIQAINSTDALPGSAGVRTDGPLGFSSQQETLLNMASTSSQYGLSVDTAIQPLLSSSVQVTLPTVNMKVPSPNTLPSLTHNKNSTIIVQSTKVPIPVASAEAAPTLLSEQHSSKSLVSSLARMVASTGESIHTAPNNSTAGLASTVSSDSTKSPSASNLGISVNMKNVMVKLATPPKGGPYVQGFMTSKGKFVIPQNALLQQHPQVIQASPNRVILANAAYNTQVQTNQMPARQAEVAASNLVNQNILKNIPISQSSILQPVQQQNGQVVITSQPSVSAQAIPIQNSNPGIKVMLINQSNVSQLQGQTNPNVMTKQDCLQTNTPASQLVKQIANSTQLLASAQQQGQQSKSIPNPAHQGAVNVASASVINFNAVSQPNVNASVQNITNSLALKTGHSQASVVSPQLAAQIIALQQSGKGLQVKQVQGPQQQAGIVLGTKPASVQQPQGQSPLMALQLQQLGNQLLSGVGGITQVQVPSTQAATQIANAQVSIGAAKAVQHGQVVQLALNPQAANAGPTVLGQPQIVQVAGQLSPHLQLANQNVSQLPHQSSIILQQPNVMQNQQQAVVRPQNTGVLPIQVNSLNQQKPGQPFKQSLVGGVALAQQPQLQASQAQIQLVINPSLASSTPLSIGTVLRKPAPVSTVRVPQLTSNPQIIRAIVNPAFGVSSTMSSPRLLSPTKLAVSLNSSPQTVLGTSPQLPQVVTQNVANANQLLISSVKFAPQVPQMNRASSVRLVNPVASSFQPSSVITNQSASQLVQKIQHFNNGGQEVNAPQGGNVPQRHVISAGLFNTTNSGPMVADKISRPFSQPADKLVNVMKVAVAGDASRNIVGGLSLSQASVVSCHSNSSGISFSGPSAIAVKPVHNDNGNQNVIALAAHQQQGVIRNSLQCEASKVSTVSSTASEGDALNCHLAKTVYGSVSDADSQTGSNDRTEESDVSTMQYINQTSGDENFVVPGNSPSGRRNTFSGSQNNFRSTLQRNTSVDDSSNTLMSKEMDEKEAALNLLTLANQPL